MRPEGTRVGDASHTEEEVVAATRGAIGGGWGSKQRGRRHPTQGGGAATLEEKVGIGGACGGAAAVLGKDGRVLGEEGQQRSGTTAGCSGRRSAVVVVSRGTAGRSGRRGGKAQGGRHENLPA
jgi:hypothetical protein